MKFPLTHSLCVPQQCNRTSLPPRKKNHRNYIRTSYNSITVPFNFMLQTNKSASTTLSDEIFNSNQGAYA